jgi:hypothetical protein
MGVDTPHNNHSQHAFWQPFGWIVQHTLVVLTLTGVVMYGVIRRAYAGFYGHFRVEPDEVGLDYVRTLSQALPAVLVAFTNFALAIMIALWVLRFAIRRGRGAGPRKAGDLAEWIAALAFLSLVITFFVTWRTLGHLAGNVEDGEVVRAAGDPSLGQWSNPLGLHAERVQVVWLGNEEAPITGLSDHCLMYLGASGGTDVFYDVSNERTLRITADRVAVIQRTKPCSSPS